MATSSRGSHLSRYAAHSFTRQVVRRYAKETTSSAISSQVLRKRERFTRMSRFWSLTGGITPTGAEDGHAKLIRAGYLRQSNPGMFHLLPLGLRVQDKLENLIDKYMSQLDASKVSLSSISSQWLWQHTDRLEGYGPELFRLTDRKETPLLLAPTHEEEITTLVGRTVKSYKSLPLRLYQIGRKYRDEIRPRHGVLRSREFVMKDLYTFDYSVSTALSTYETVRKAYNELFNELRLPYLVAEASSGDIGGDLSHEYHLPSPIGEDNVISCKSCDYVANEELAVARPEQTDASSTASRQVWRGISKDRNTLVNVWYPDSFSDADINTHAIKAICPGLDSGLEDALPLWEAAVSKTASTSHKSLTILNIVDHRLGSAFANDLIANPDEFEVYPNSPPNKPVKFDYQCVTSTPGNEPFNAIRIRDGDHCPRCTSGELKVQKAIELGHTFHLGTKYSDALEARIQVPNALLEAPAQSSTDTATLSKSNDQSMVSIQMGCHGIGVSRIIGAVANHLADDKGLNWPRAIAPFDVIVVPGKGTEKDADDISSMMTEPSEASSIDLIVDDRTEPLPWKLKDADLIGYPVVLVLGRRWSSDRMVEVQCRRLGVKEFVPVDALLVHVNTLLAQL
ncbi:hypothetical protein F5Y18DRAFT_373878 [Xylariaceae sp. FL1019]|nr:hypothetical protein F5Y18DRAFT_373878 [Xylariaceae sp. FL1019]